MRVFLELRVIRKNEWNAESTCITHAHPSRNEWRMRMNDGKTFDASTFARIEQRQNETICSSRRKRQRRNPHVRRRLRGTGSRSDDECLMTQCAQAIAKRVDARDDAVANWVITFRKYSYAHYEVGLVSGRI